MPQIAPDAGRVEIKCRSSTVGIISIQLTGNDKARAPSVVERRDTGRAGDLESVYRLTNRAGVERSALWRSRYGGDGERQGAGSCQCRRGWVRPSTDARGGRR